MTITTTIVMGAILATIDTTRIIDHIIHTHIIHTKEEIQMYYHYQPYPYYRRYYNLDPYYYRRYYNPYYNYQQNIIDSQIANVNQRIDNFGVMTDVIQNSDIYQSMTPEPEPVGICTTPTEPPTILPI